MIEILHLEKKEFPYGFSVLNVKAQDSIILDKSARGNFYHMFFVKSGEVNLQIDTHQENIMKGECGFIGINQVFKVTTPTDFEVLILKFDENFYCRHDIDIHFLNSCFFFDNSRGIIKHGLDSATQVVLEQHYEALRDIHSKPYNDLMYYIAHNTVERLLLFCQKRLINDPAIANRVINPDNELMHNFRQLVKMHFKQQKQLQFYADELNTSIKRLTEACKNIYDQSPKKIITEQIILEAKRLLLYSSLNIKEIAFELKFEEPSNFIRFFIRATDMTPKQYREISTKRGNNKKA